MGGDQVDLSSDEPGLLVSPAKSNTCPREGYAKSQPQVPDVLPFSYIRAGVLQNSHQNYSEIYPRGFCLPVQPGLSESNYEYTTSPLDDGELNTRSTGGETGLLGSLTGTIYLGQWIEMAEHSPRFCECASIGLLDPNDVLAVHTCHPGVGSTTGFRYDGETVDVLSSQRHRRGLSGNLRPPIENKLNDCGFVLPQRTLQDQELPSLGSADKGVFGLSSSFFPQEISSSLKTQGQYLGELPSIRNRGRYLCEICGDAFAQPQGVRRHHLEKHEPKTCPHCHTFKWARLYLFKKHLREAHPYEDTKAATLDRARRDRRKSVTANRARIHSCSTLRIHRARNRCGDTTRRQMTLPPLAGPETKPASTLEPQAEILNIFDDDARDGACVICGTRTGPGRFSTAALGL
ncbi:hypothetical protein H4582DRAFT_2160294 [Lactarius indigo]|nr:hypothetical protein H4582DRAFT_2160294 [Lactarius indigo]